MSGSTTELALKTAVDADDTADYLTLSLADSLRTLDALYNNVTGHNHNGAHQGGPITSIPAGSIPDGSITSAKIADGTIATADLANGAVTNAKLASDTARANLLTNGGFEIWQRGNGPFTSVGARGPDMWTVNPAGTDTLSVSRDTANVDGGSAYCAACTFTLGNGAGGSQFYQGNMSDLAPSLKGRTVTFSARVKCSTANAVRLGLNVTPQVYSSYHSGSGQYETLSVTGVCGTSITVAQVNVFFAASCTAYIDNAMLVVGSVPADFAPPHPADDLARCLRYYETGTFGIRYYSGSLYGIVNLPVKAVKAVTPTLTITPGSRGNVASTSQQNLDTRSVTWNYIATATNTDTYALNDTYILEANP